MRAIERRLDRLASELCKLLAGNKCYMGEHEGSSAHHIIKRGHRRQRWNQDNLVWLCFKHHRQAEDGEIFFESDLSIKFKIWSLPELQELEKEIKMQIKAIK